MGNVWLSEWSDDAYREEPMNTGVRLGVYAALGFEQSEMKLSHLPWTYGEKCSNMFYLFSIALAVLMQSVSLAIGCTIAAKVIHSNLLDGIIQAPMAFFDTTPLGRILNRFSQDLNVLDTNMRFTCNLFLRGVASLIATVIAISYTTPIFLAFVVPLLVGYYLVQASTHNSL